MSLDGAIGGLLVLLMMAGCGQGMATRSASGMLFPIVDEDGRMGFIDTSGRVVIAPRFHAVGDFSEGLAAAREGGLYGYIDATGAFAIAPRWDYATEFHCGRAVVYEDSVPVVIDRSGRKVFGGAFAAIEPFEHGVAVVRAHLPWNEDAGGRGRSDPRQVFGQVDSSGRLIVDTVLVEIRPFRQGQAIVRARVDSLGRLDPQGNELAAGVIDTLGNPVIPLGTFEDILDDEGEYYKVGLRRNPEERALGMEGSSWGFADRTGRLLFSRRFAWGLGPTGPMRDGLVPVKIGPLGGCFHSRDEADSCYAGYLDTTGRVAFSSKDWEYARPFHRGRAVVSSRRSSPAGESDWVIDTKGRILHSEPMRLIDADAFEEGGAWVSIGGTSQIVDTNLTPVWPESAAIRPAPASGGARAGGHGIAQEQGRGMPGVSSGVRKPFQGIIRECDRRGYRGGMHACRTDRGLVYLDSLRQVVWEGADPSDEAAAAAVDVDRVLRGANWLRSMPAVDSGAGPLQRDPGLLERLLRAEPPRDSLWIHVDAWRELDFRGEFVAHPVRIVNTFPRPITFRSPSEGLPIRVEALDRHGVWRTIVAPAVSYPNSDFAVDWIEGSLAGGQEFAQVVPVFHGAFKTRLRLALQYVDRLADSAAWADHKAGERPRRGPYTAYSNEFTGRVNPAQLWRVERGEPQSVVRPRTPWETGAPVR